MQQPVKLEIWPGRHSVNQPPRQEYLESRGCSQRIFRGDKNLYSTPAEGEVSREGGCANATEPFF
jgi:hypothetical protein